MHALGILLLNSKNAGKNVAVDVASGKNHAGALSGNERSLF